MNSEETTIRETGRNWLLEHSRYNPYKWFGPGLPRLLSSPFRVLPDYIIIGARRSGTSSLYDYLQNHPSVFPALGKEITFYSHFFEKGLTWYRSFFPTKFEIKKISQIQGEQAITGEGTPYYFFHPLVPQRIRATIPNVKLIVLLRNPIDRAWSDYQKSKRLHEHLSFEQAIKTENERLRHCSYNSIDHQVRAYTAQGLYFNQLQNWLKHFPIEQILILKSEDFFKDPQSILKTTFKFLGIRQMTLNIKFERHNEGKYAEISESIRNQLNDYFKPHNEKLEKLLGRKFDWDK